MDIFANLSLGFSVASSLENLLFCFIGVTLGTLIGVLPGIGATATIAMLLPITFQIGDPVSSLIMLAGIYYGAQYGGSTTAILINMPGESSSAVTAIDGYQMARRGRAGVALSVAAIGSFFAGSVSTFLVALLAPPLTLIALKFGAAEYFSLMLVGLVSSIALASGSVVKALAMLVLGLLLGREHACDQFAQALSGHPRLADGGKLAFDLHHHRRVGREEKIRGAVLHGQPQVRQNLDHGRGRPGTCVTPSSSRMVRLLTPASSSRFCR